MCLRSNYRVNKRRAIGSWGTCAPMRVFISVPRGDHPNIYILTFFMLLIALSQFVSEFQVNEKHTRLSFYFNLFSVL